MANDDKLYKTSTLGDVLKPRGFENTRIFWNGLVTTEQKHDMIELGLCPNMKVLPPTIVKYIEEVIFEGRNRQTVFPKLPKQWGESS